MRTVPRLARTDVLPLVLLTGLTVLVRAWNLEGHPFPNDDEGTYVAQAWAVRSGRGMSHYTYWYDHPPLAWVQLGALWWLPAQLAPDAPTLVQGRIAMLPVAAATGALLYVVARRLGLHRAAAAGAVLLNALSPLAIGMQRQVFLDNFAVPWALASLVLVLSPRRHLWHHVAAGVAFTAAVLCKETACLLLPALLVALWQAGHPKTRLFSMTGFAAGLLVSLCYPLYAMLNKELLPGECHVSLLSTLVWQTGGRAGSGSVLTEHTVANALVHQWYETDPFLVAGGVLAGFAALALRPTRPLGLAVVLPVLVALRPDGYMPKMYVAQTLVFLALALVAVLEPAVRTAWRTHHGRMPVRVTVVTGCALLALGGVAPWHDERDVLTADVNGGYRQAARWLHGGDVADKERTRLVTDGVLWLDAVRAGFAPGGGAIWHYKLDKDPAVVASLPDGWRDVDYLLATPTIEEAQKDLPSLRALLRRGEVVKAFGHGQIEVLRITDAVRKAGGKWNVPVDEGITRCLGHTEDIWPHG